MVALNGGPSEPFFERLLAEINAAIGEAVATSKEVAMAERWVGCGCYAAHRLVALPNGDVVCESRMLAGPSGWYRGDRPQWLRRVDWIHQAGPAGRRD